MTWEADQLLSTQTIVDQLARHVEARQGHGILGQRVPLDDVPGSVRAACQFYTDALYIADDGPIGDGSAFLLPPETGSVYLVLGFDAECCRGAVEIYSPAGDVLAAGVFRSAVVGWTDVTTARQFIAAGELPPGLLVPPATLEWIVYDPVACLSVGGRFFIRPDFSRGGSPASLLEDGETGITHTCDSVTAAQELAAQLHAQA